MPDWSWKHAERRNAEGRWVPAIKVTYPKGQLFDRYVPGWVVFETQEEAREENERVAAGFAERIGLPLTPAG